MANYRILLVFPRSKQELEEEIREKLEEQLFEDNLSQPSRVSVDWARSEADALLRLGETSYALVVCYLHIPADNKATLREEEQRGLSFLVSFKRDKPRTPFILVVTTTDNRVSESMKGYRDGFIIQEGQELENRFLEMSRRLISQCPIGKPTCRVDMDINLDKKNDTSTGKYLIESIEKGLKLEGQIFLDSQTLKRILEDSKRLEEEISKSNGSGKDWESKFQRLGEDLSKAIQDRNTKFLLRQKEAAMKVGGFENTRIRFILTEDCHSIIFEALMDEEQQLLMLQAPMYRRLNLPSSSDLPPLFMEDLGSGGPINCLIIEADAQGMAKGLKGGDKEFEKLKKLREETSWLLEYLQGKSRGNVELISRKKLPKGKSFREYLEEVLYNQTWDLVHFTGHSLCDVDDTGYLILPVSKGKGVETLDISKFAFFLRRVKTRFLYLNSCESSAAAMVFKLADQQIPAIMGFRCAVQDEMAFLYAQNFYQHLFEKRSLEQSFFYARKEMHEKYKDPRSSAALLLILQTP
ncbi:MAG: CHAT domain-containing protein [Syntrophales bacterium]|nr:CHAT domain-containing protein [Syntrophales bacterium]